MEEKNLFEEKKELLNLNYISRLLNFLAKNEETKNFEIEETINGKKFKIQKKNKHLVVSCEDGRTMSLDLSVLERDKGYRHYKGIEYDIYASMYYLLPNRARLEVSEHLNKCIETTIPCLKTRTFSLDEDEISVSYENYRLGSNAIIWQTIPYFSLNCKDSCDVLPTQNGFEIFFRNGKDEHYKVMAKNGKANLVLSEEDINSKDITSLIDSYNKHLPTCKEALNVYQYLYKDLDKIVFSKQELSNVIVSLEEKIKAIERKKFDSKIKELSDEEYTSLKKVLK